MKKMKMVVLPFGLALMLCVFGVANAVVVTFDDLPGDETQIPTGYNGFTWNNFHDLDGVHYASNPSGYGNGVISPNNVAYNSFGDAASITGPLFTFNSAYFTGAWNDGLNIEITGRLSGTTLFDQTIVVDSTGPTLFSPNWAGIDELDFFSSGGTSHGYISGGSGEHFAMDNFTYNAVPEPTTMLLVGSGLLGLWGARRKFKK
jgi:hypothetical protein